MAALLLRDAPLHPHNRASFHIHRSAEAMFFLVVI